MKPIQWPRAVLPLLATAAIWAATIHGPHNIDTQHSTLTVHVAKSGMLSAFGHDHTIVAPIASGAVDAGARRVELNCHAAALRVRDPNASDKDRAEIQKQMLGPEVLDVERYPEIAFRSSGAEEAAGGWNVRGDLTIRGKTRPVTVRVTEKDGRYTGTARFRQSEFGIQPIKIAGGAMRVKDELRIDFDIQLAR